MRKYILVLIIALFSLKMGDVQAACTETPNCTEMGFTKTVAECEYGSVKCPWNTGLVYCKNRRAKCQIGWIYYDDGTCSADVKSGKTALGVVAYVNPDGIGGQVISHWPIDKNGNKSYKSPGILWAYEDYNILTIPNYISIETVVKDFNSCANTYNILNNFQSSYPAAQATKLYAPTTETRGNWCLPAAGVMASIYNNQSVIQAGIRKLGGVEFLDCCTWSSSEYSYNSAWYFSLGSSYGLRQDYKHAQYNIRPVLEF